MKVVKTMILLILCLFFYCFLFGGFFAYGSQISQGIWPLKISGSDVLLSSIGYDLGVGVTSAGFKLHVRGNNDNLCLQQYDAGGTYNGILFRDHLGVTTGMIRCNQTTGNIELAPNLAGSDVYISGTSNLGIGHSSPECGIHVGSTASNHSLTSQNDVHVSGKLEVDGSTYIDSTIYFGAASDTGVNFGHGLALYQNGTYDQWGIFTDSGVGKQVVIGSFDYRQKDFDHALCTDPTLFIHSDTDPDSDNTEWISLKHDKSDGILDVGKGSIKFADKILLSTSTITMADTGDPNDARLNLIPANYGTVIDLVCNDVTGCTVQIQETGAQAGEWHIITCSSVSSGIDLPERINQYDGPTVPTTLLQGSNIEIVYVGGKWLQVSTEAVNYP